MDDQFFIQHSFPSLNLLTLGNCYSIKGNWQHYNLEWLKTLKTLTLMSCTSIISKFFEINKFPKLRCLQIHDMPQLSSYKLWIPLLQLEQIRIDSSNSVGIDRYLINDYSKHLDHSPLQYKRIFPKLKNIKFSCPGVLGGLYWDTC